MKQIIGIDVGKFNLDIAFDEQLERIFNNDSEIRNFLNKLSSLCSLEEIMIVCEATGGYEQKLMRIAREYPIAIHIAHPNKIRAFAKSKGLLAKTDRMDAVLIKSYAETMSVKPTDIFLSETAEIIAQTIKRRQQLVDDRSREQSKLDKEICEPIKQSIKSHVKWLDKAIKGLDRQLEQQTKQQEINTAYNLLESIPGVGKLTALSLLVFLPELGQLTHKQLAALVGLAPFNRDSGCYKGKRFIQGGRAIMRKALYMSAVASLRWNKELKDFYDRLIKVGKPAKVALVAVMRKLLMIANSIIKRQSPWVSSMT